MKASEIMTEDVITIRGSASVAEAVRLMKENQIHALIVDRRNEEDAYGIVTDSDVVYKVTAYGKDPKKVKVYEIMTKPCIAVNPNLAVEYVARLFAQTQIQRAPVIQNTLLGIISITDILTKSDFVEAPSTVILQDEIEKYRTAARAICAEKGPTSRECAVAWDIVEELQATAAYQRAEKIEKTYFEEYCEENPDALEARMYDA
ncbi:CP12 domain-containing protein [Gloeocapsa sp. PCC 73106]|uniref:CP12 domain-containing protein n=1 Tax=Gloeocapsa sp. PCC 73106 TaxID=102232 RepID=UPI0002AC4034|nr:CP12 domain-containing protein [Gloeocapsa sp. PCC 73106]ELR97775.1 CBS domain-containing protein [Gloeocapsa sp. PCC 73106]